MWSAPLWLYRHDPEACALREGWKGVLLSLSTACHPSTGLFAWMRCM